MGDVLHWGVIATTSLAFNYICITGATDEVYDPPVDIPDEVPDTPYEPPTYPDKNG